MKNAALFLSLSFCITLLFVAGHGLGSSFGPIDGFAGNPPSAQNCTTCHTGAPVNSGNGSLEILGLPAIYEPGMSFPLTISLADPGQSRWGFELAILDSNHHHAGTISVTEPARTQLSNNDPPGIAPDFLKQTHFGTYAGTFNGPIEWQFLWNAPALPAGPVTVWVSGLAANNNNMQSGDFTYTAAASATSDFVPAWTPITVDPTPHDGPRFSPDGGSIAYMKMVAGRWQLAVTPADGSGPEEVLTTDAVDHWFPRWSPDGGTLAYTRLGPGAVNQIFVIPAAGGSELPLTFSSGDHRDPRWSPDGEGILYSRVDGSGFRQIHEVAPGGGPEVPHTSSPRDHQHPAWLPDGSGFLMSARDDGGTFQIARQALGGDETFITSSPLDHYLPVPDPAGAMILCTRGPGSDLRLVTLPMGGGPEVEISGGANDVGGTWSPCGTIICYDKGAAGGDSFVYWKVVAEPGEAPLSQGAALARAPAFSPDGSRVAFVSDAAGGFLQVGTAELPAGSGAAIFIRGDADGNGELDLGDVLQVLNFLFLAGPASEPLDAADANDSGAVGLDDAIGLILYLSAGGEAPPAPFPAPGPDPTPDPLPGC